MVMTVAFIRILPTNLPSHSVKSQIMLQQSVTVECMIFQGGLRYLYTAGTMPEHE